jgi:hypothetical protein
MPAATRTESSLTTLPITVTSFFTALRTALTNAGFPNTVITNQTSAGYIVYEITLASGFTKGRLYIKISASISGDDLTVKSSCLDSWNTALNTGTNESTEATFSTAIKTNTPIYFSAFSHPEARLVCIHQAAPLLAVIGYVRPATKYSWWNENNFVFGFIPKSELLQEFYNPSTAGNPYNNGSALQLLNPNLKDPNPISGRRDVKPAPDLLSFEGMGVAGTFSADILVAATNTIAKFDLIYISATEIYTALHPSPNSGFCIRTT